MTGQSVKSAEAMMDLGGKFSAKAKAGDVFGLIGTLGTGKTHWTKGFVRFQNPEATVSSPTFGIINEYRGGKHTVFHFDFYRLKSARELLDLGWDEYLDESAITVCEWADLFPELMPDHTVWLEITHSADGTRMFSVTDRPEKNVLP